MAIKKKGMGKPMKKADNGTTLMRKKPARTVSGIISEDGDMADDLNAYLKAKSKGQVPLDPNIQKGIKNGTLNPDGTIKTGTKRGSESNMSRTPMKKGGMIKKAKSGGSFPDLNKDGKVTKADVLKGRGVIAKKGAKVAKMAKCKYGCK